MFTGSIACLAHMERNSACNGDSGGPAILNGEPVGVAEFVIAPIPMAMQRCSTTATGSLTTPICNLVKAFLANIKWQLIYIV